MRSHRDRNRERDRKRDNIKMRIIRLCNWVQRNGIRVCTSHY